MAKRDWAGLRGAAAQETDDDQTQRPPPGTRSGGNWRVESFLKRPTLPSGAAVRYSALLRQVNTQYLIMIGLKVALKVSPAGLSSDQFMLDCVMLAFFSDPNVLVRVLRY